MTAQPPFSARISRKSALIDIARRLWSEREKQRLQFPDEVFANAHWDILLICFLQNSEKRPLSVGRLSDLIAGSKTAKLRRIEELEVAGLIERLRDPDDARRTLVILTDEGHSRMSAYLRDLDPPGGA